MGCCPSSPVVGEGREPLLAQHHHDSASASSPYAVPHYSQPATYAAPAVPSSSSSYSASFAPSPARKRDAKIENENENESVGTKATEAPLIDFSGAVIASTASLPVVDAPRAEGTENMTKEEEFEFYKSRMEQLNREKAEANARFEHEEREKQKLLEAQRQQNSARTKIRNFFKGEEGEGEEEFAIGAPQGFKHESHIGWTPEGGFDIFNIPNEWKQLLSKAGVTQEQMQDKQTAMFIVSFVASTLQQGSKPAPPSRKNPIPVALNSSPTPAPAPQQDVSTEAEPAEAQEKKQEEEESAFAPSESDIPAAPPAPIAPPAPVAVSADSVAPPPPKAAPAPSVANLGSTDNMFSSIREGVKLRKAAALPDVKNLSLEEEDTLAGALARALQSRRFVIEEDEDEPEEEENNDEWDD